MVGLTTIRQKVAEQGAAAARALLDLLTQSTADSARSVQDAPIELVVRSTTAGIGSPGAAPDR